MIDHTNDDNTREPIDFSKVLPKNLESSKSNKRFMDKSNFVKLETEIFIRALLYNIYCLFVGMTVRMKKLEK